VGGGFGVLEADVENRERHVDDAHAELEGRFVVRLGVEGGDVVGATLRCSQASGLPCPSTPARDVRTDTVWK